MENLPPDIGRFLIPAPPDGLSVDYVNTRYWRGTDTPTETFATIDDVLRWCGESAGIPAGMVESVRLDCLHDEEAALTDAIALREILYQLYLANAEGAEPSSQDLSAIGEFLRDAAPRDELLRNWWAV